MIEPAAKRLIGFIDGQNLFYAARQAFGYSCLALDPRDYRPKAEASQ
jgi:hypothetical protein